MNIICYQLKMAYNSNENYIEPQMAEILMLMAI